MRNKLCFPSSFLRYSTDLEIATPKLMSEQSATYSTYRRINFFQVIIGDALSVVITYMTGLCILVQCLTNANILYLVT